MKMKFRWERSNIILLSIENDLLTGKLLFVINLIWPGSRGGGCEGDDREMRIRRGEE